MWTFDKFEAYMLESGLTEEGWVENYVRPVMRKTMLHIVRMASNNLLKHPRVFELLGVDFLFDSNLHLWFLELNRSPAM